MIEKLSEMWENMTKEKENAIQAVKDTGYGLMKSALAFREEANGKTEL